MLGDKKFISRIQIQNLLSYGPEAPAIDLESLNVLIGPNACGKSNLIEAIDLLRACPKDLTVPFRESGGIKEWLWKGAGNSLPSIKIETVVRHDLISKPLRHRIELSENRGGRLKVLDEALEETEKREPSDSDVRVAYRYQRGNPVIGVLTDPDENGGPSPILKQKKLHGEHLFDNQSILSQKKDIDHYPAITWLGMEYDQIDIFREWSLGRHAPARMPQPTDLPVGSLEENGRNLGLVFNSLFNQPELKSIILEKLREFNPFITDFRPEIYGNNLQIFLHEEGVGPIPATRLSDGTLRFLFLLAILLNPDPPSLTCIEEPELGMHPDMMPVIADLLVDASQRTQLIVTTHSVGLVDALSETPEAVMVCEKEEGQTNIQRLDRDDLADWLKRYSLGQLWQKGEIGGTRW
jgi:predicted ATPase